MLLHHLRAFVLQPTSSQSSCDCLHYTHASPPQPPNSLLTCCTLYRCCLCPVCVPCWLFVGMMDPTGAYAGMYGSYDGSQVAMAQQGYGAMQPPSFSSKEEMKQHASSYVQQQLAMMGHQPSSRGSGSSSKRDSAAGYSMQDMSYSGAAWQGGGYGQEGTAAAAAAAAAPTGVKKTGRGRGRPPGSKNQNNIAKGLENAAAAAAAAAASAVEQQQLYQQQQQYSMNARASQDEAATWCSTGMLLAGSAAAAAAGAGAPTGSPATDMHSSANFMMSLPNGNTAAAAADLLDPAALAAAPVPLAPGAMEASTSGLAAADAAAAAAAATAGSDGITAGMPECNGLLPTSAAAAAELNRLPLANQFRVSMSGLDFELDAAGAANTMRFSARSLKLFEVEDGPCMPHYKASIGSIDFRTSLTSFDDILGGQATNRMSDHTHIALRGPSWDGGSPNSRPSDDTAAGAAAAVPSADAAAAAATGYANGSSSADDALAVAFRQQQQQQTLMPPPGSCGMMAGTWVAAQQPPNSAAAAAAVGPPALPNSLSGVPSGPMAIPPAAPMQEEIHPGAIAAPAAVAAAMGAAAPGGETPFGSARLQAAPFSPVAGAAAAAAVLAGPPDLLAHDSHAADQATLGPCLGGTGAAAAAGTAAMKAVSRAPPPAPRMPLAFHSVLQALQPPAAACSGSSAAAAAGTAGAAATGMTGIKQEPLQHPQAQQQPGCDVALAAASPAITGISVATCKAPVPSFTMPAAATAAGSVAGLHQQQQMPMPMPLPPQLLLPPQQQQQPVLHRMSDLALPSPIDLFHGDHGLHPDDLLIDAETVFDEQMLLASHHHQQQQQQQQRGRVPLEAAALQHSMHFAAAAADSMRSQAGPAAGAAAAVIGGSTRAVSPADALGSTAGAAVSSAAHPAAAAAAAAGPEPGPAGDKQGQKRRRSSANGSSWGKKHRPSEGSLVEVYGTSHGIDDCLNFWHD